MNFRPNLTHAVEVGVMTAFGMTIGMIIGLLISDKLNGDAALTIAGGFAGAVSAVLGALYVEGKRHRDKKAFECKQVRKQLAIMRERLLTYIPVVRTAIDSKGGYPDEAVTRIGSRRLRLSPFIEEALSSGQTLNFVQRGHLRHVALGLTNIEECVDEAFAKRTGDWIAPADRLITWGDHVEKALGDAISEF